MVGLLQTALPSLEYGSSDRVKSCPREFPESAGLLLLPWAAKVTSSLSVAVPFPSSRSSVMRAANILAVPKCAILLTILLRLIRGVLQAFNYLRGQHSFAVPHLACLSSIWDSSE